MLVTTVSNNFVGFPEYPFYNLWSSDGLKLNQICPHGLIFYKFASQDIYPICSKFTLSLPPENIRKPYGFLMFAGATERVHWEQMGLLYLYEAEA